VAHSNRTIYCACQCHCTVATTQFRCVSGSLRLRQSATAAVSVWEARHVGALPGGLPTVPSRRREAGAGEADQSAGVGRRRKRRRIGEPPRVDQPPPSVIPSSAFIHSFSHSVSQSVISPLNCCAHHHCTSLQAWIAARIAVVHATGITEHHKLPGSH
jgi:hypothetical protein